MSQVKVKDNGQITIPKHIREQLGIVKGDVVEIGIERGKVVMMRVNAAAKLSVREQRLLALAKQKIKAINEDILHSTGLTEEEADVAAKANLIDLEQKYWWLETWQQGERQAERDDREGNYTEYDNSEDFLKSLGSSR